MYPLLFHNEYIIIDSYSILFFLAWTIAGLLFYYFIKQKKLNVVTMLTILCGCALGALFGSFVFNIILFGQEEFLSKLYNLDFNGMSVVGGISGGFIGVEVAKKMIGYKNYTGDLFVIPILIGHTIGRLGCLLGGCCFGIQCHLPWSITYPINSPAYFHQLEHGIINLSSLSTIAVHPTPVYEMIFNLCLLAIFWMNKSWFKISGALFRGYIVAYCLFRFFMEFLRADTGFAILLGLKPIQINLLIAVLYFSWWLWKNNRSQSKLMKIH